MNDRWGGRRPPVPDYAGGESLAAVLPAIARSLGVTRYASVPDLGLAPVPRTVVVLIDGLGHDVLVRRYGHTPFLRSLSDTTVRLDCGFPSTTATSMGTFGTGTPCGEHGLVGFEVLDPGAGRVFNELSWENGPDPYLWQPARTVFQECEWDGVDVTRVGPGFFDGSGLTNAALRGGRFVAATSLSARVDAAVAAAGRMPRTLVYLYWGDLDKAGHVHGADSWEVVDELESVDRALGQLAARIPADCSLVVTADHGMVDVPFQDRVDLAAEPALLAGVRYVGGEPRGTQLYLEPDQPRDEVVERWRDRLGRAAWVGTREELVAEGWVGAVRDEVWPRIGDVLVLMLDANVVVDSRRMRPELLRLYGQHGSVTEAERGIPLVRVPARNL